MSATKNEESALNIPDILADFFLKKFEMPKQSEKSDVEYDEKRKKSKHKKRKHKKHKHKRSRDCSTEKDSAHNKMAEIQDRSDSEEREIKRLKKIKNMEIKDVSKLCMQYTATNLSETVSNQNLAYSSSTKCDIPYGPSIELLLTGTESCDFSSHSNLVMSSASNTIVTSYSQLEDLKSDQENILVSDNDTAKCITDPQVISLGSSSVDSNDDNNSKSSKLEIELLQITLPVTEAKKAENVITLEKADLKFNEAKHDCKEKIILKDDANVLDETLINDSRDTINAARNKAENKSDVKSHSSSSNEKSKKSSDLTSKFAISSINEEISYSKSDKSESQSHCSKSRSKTHSPPPSSSTSRSVTKQRKEARSRCFSASKSRSSSKFKKYSKTNLKDKQHTRHRRKSASRSRSSCSNESDVSHSKFDKKKVSRTNDRKRNSRSHSKDRNHTKHSSRKYSRSRSSSRRRTYNRSRSNEKHRLKLQKVSRSRSRNRLSHKPHEKSRSRSKSHSRKSSLSIRHRSKHRRSSTRSRSRSQSYSKSKTKSHHKNFSGSQSKRNSHFSSPSTSRQRSPSRLSAKSQHSPKTKEKTKSTESEDKIDQAKILEIARKNMLTMIEKGTLPEGLSLEKFKKEQLVSIKAGGKSVQELTDFCVKLSKRENDPNFETEDKNEDADSGFIHHPFKLKEQSLIKLNIKNAVQVPIKTHAEKVAETARLSSQFPVSSGNQHKQKELQWIPVEPDKAKAEPKLQEIKSQTVENTVTEVETSSTTMLVTQSSNPSATVCYPYIPPATAPNVSVMSTPFIPPPPPLPLITVPPPNFNVIASYKPPVQQNMTIPNVPMQPKTSVFKPVKLLDIPSIVTMRFKALTKLQENPNDEHALSALNQAEESIQHWVQSQQVPGLFTGSTDAKLLSVEELCGPRNFRVKRTFGY